MLQLTVKVGQTVKIGDDLFITVDEKQGRRVRLCFDTQISPIQLLKTPPVVVETPGTDT
ncbi:carbon storage regulator (plasmid) [Brucella anthropi]|uniref:carbon storage regulator n=1 Tax=Brucella anthropi TaxID=529 RepID=UPI001BCBA8ED